MFQPSKQAVDSPLPLTHKEIDNIYNQLGPLCVYVTVNHIINFHKNYRNIMFKSLWGPQSPTGNITVELDTPPNSGVTCRDTPIERTITSRLLDYMQEKTDTFKHLTKSQNQSNIITHNLYYIYDSQHIPYRMHHKTVRAT